MRLPFWFISYRKINRGWSFIWKWPYMRLHIEPDDRSLFAFGREWPL